MTNFLGTFDELMSMTFVGKTIKCNKMEHYDEEFREICKKDFNNANPKIVPNAVVLVKEIYFEGDNIWINRNQNEDDWEYRVPIDSIIEII